MKNSLGIKGEKAVRRYLRFRLYKIVECNYKSNYGEIDIIARRFGTLAFVEVKTRKDNIMGTPSQAVTLQKQQKIIKTAYAYLKRNPQKSKLRLDVAEVVVINNKTQINYIKNAFEEEW